MNGINTNFGSERIYTGKSTVPHENAGDFSSLISKSEKLSQNNESDFDFSDMYVRTYQHTPEEAILESKKRR